MYQSLQQVPVWQTHKHRIGTLITAGMDGDEYEGIQAAYNLIDHFTKHPPKTPITIIPILNQPGFTGMVSFNPLDQKFPKSIYPGSASGTDSEQLIYWLTSQFVDHATLWLDLHSGASDESLTPFIWAGKSTQKTVDQQTLATLKSLPGLKIYENFSSLPIKNIPYLMFESGAGDRHNPEDIDRLVNWVLTSLNLKKSSAESSVILTKVTYTYAPCAGFWDLYSLTTKKGLIKLDPKSIDVVLWSKLPQFVVKNTLLFATAC